MVNALVALRAADATTLRTVMQAEQPAADVDAATQALALAPLPVHHVPKAVLELPAQVLLRHPAVRAAESDAAAAWADIGVARADRLPRIDLAAALTGEWIRSAGTTLRYVAWSLGPTVNGTLFDGGASAANVDAAEARYRAAVAALRLAVLSATEDVENALAARQSADARATLTKESADEARTTFIATEDQWRAGAVSLFELEDARRELTSALDSAVAADRDRGQAWVALVKASGNAISNPLDATP
jgi:outer membrane protein TolC